jgi:hypothetical protein
MCLAITVINSRIILGPNSTWSALPGILDLVAGAVPFAILAAATSLGCLGIARMADGAEPMRRTLPLAHRKVLLWNLGLSLTLFAACASVPWAIHLAAELSVRGRVTDLLTDSLLAGTALLIGWHAATPIEPRLLPIAAIAAMIYTANLLYSSPPSMLALFTVLIGTLLLLPLSARLAWRREV